MLNLKQARERFTALSVSGTLGLMLVDRDDGARLALQVQADTLFEAGLLTNGGIQLEEYNTRAEIAKLGGDHDKG